MRISGSVTMQAQKEIARNLKDIGHPLPWQKLMQKCEEQKNFWVGGPRWDVELRISVHILAFADTHVEHAVSVASFQISISIWVT